VKSILKVLALLIVWSSGAWITSQEASAQQGYVSFQVFYDELSPYGMWVNYPNYGYVWIPDVDREFSPYGTDGHWVFTDDGWTWVSDYSWGWAPFHYGRWAYNDSYGWIWVPHNEWGPAWVTWRRSEGYYGWAPMEPGMSIEVYFGGGHRVPNDRWIFVRDRDFNRPDIDRHYVDRSTNVTIINNSTVINNTYMDNSRHTKYVAGPARDDVQKVTGTAIKPVAIRENDKPGQTLSNDQLKIYRPQVQTSNTSDRKPAPSKLVSLKEVKPVSERKPGNQQRNENVPAIGKEQSTQPQNANPPGTKAAGEQPRVVNPPAKNKSDQQPSQPPVARPSDNIGRGQQPPVVNPPAKSKSDQQPLRPQVAKPSDKMGRGQQPRIVNPPAKNKSDQQPLQPQVVRPSDKKGREQKPPTVSPPNKGQQPQPRNVNPSNNKGKEQQPQDVAPPKKDSKAEPSPPKTNQDEKEKPKRE
jgi:hypothetical protein